MTPVSIYCKKCGATIARITTVAFKEGSAVSFGMSAKCGNKNCRNLNEMVVDIDRVDAVKPKNHRVKS